MSDVTALANEIQAMKPADRLRLAAGLVEKGEYHTAEIIAKTVVTELTAIRLFPGLISKK